MLLNAQNIVIKKLDEEFLIIKAEFRISENKDCVVDKFFAECKKERLDVTKEIIRNESLWDGVIYIVCGGDRMALGQFFILARKNDILDDEVLMANLKALDIYFDEFAFNY
jgi:hypothetical protein